MRRAPLALVFAGMGGTTAVVPALIPSYAAALGVGTEQLTPAASTLFFGVLLGVVVAPWLGRRLSLGVLLRVGAGAQLAGLVLIGVAPHPVVYVVAALLAGFGFGTCEVTAASIVRIMRETMAAPFTFLTAVLAASASVTPLLVVAAASVDAVRVVPFLVAVVQAVIVFWPRIELAEISPTSDPAVRSQPARSGVLVLLALAIGCFVGAESILAGWSAVVPAELLDAAPAVAAFGTTAFWVLMTIGRFVGAALATRAPNGPLAVAYLSVLLLGLVGAVLAPAPWLAVAATGVAVLAAGPLYGLLLSSGLFDVAPSAALRMTSRFVLVGSAGGALAPLAVVLVGGSTTLPMLVAAVFAGGALGLFLAGQSSRVTRSRRTAE